MKIFIEPITLLVSIAFCSLTTIVYLVPTTNKNLKIENNQIEIKTSCDKQKDKELNFFSHLPPGGLGVGNPQ